MSFAPSDFTSGLAPLLIATRNEIVENIHHGAVAHVNARGDLLGHVGNPHWLSFTRSTLKALQALPLVEGGGHELFEFNTKQTALLCASHGGEDAHVAEVDGMLRQIRLPYKALQCGCHLPAVFTSGGQKPPAQLQYDERHNNCSGKHAGMLAYCVQHNLPIQNYIAFDHPLQAVIRRAIAQSCGIDLQKMPWGIDGCSAPNYAMPLSALALGFARVASACRGQAEGVSDARAQAMKTLGRAMTAEPYMVSGTCRSDLAFMEAGEGDLITKVGADAVQVVASVSRGEAFALKIADASKDALYAVTVEILKQLDWLTSGQLAKLERWRMSDIRNVKGLSVGFRKPVFLLRP